MALSTPHVLPLVLLVLLPPALRDYYLSAPAAQLSNSKDAAGDSGAGRGSEVFHPLILLPGGSCSNLEARLTEAYRPSEPRCGAMKGKGWFGLWNNVSDLEANGYVDCFLEQMRLVYDPAVNDYRNLPGVETRVPNFGSVAGFHEKEPLKSNFCLGKLKGALENMGYRDGDTMFGAAYDFRYAPPSPGQTSEVYSLYFKQLMELVETASKKKQKKAVIFGHSLGGMVALEFVRNAPMSWRDEYIHHLILVAPTLSGGFMEPVRNIASGSDDIVVLPSTTPLSRRAMWRSFETAIMNFPSPAVFGREPIVVTRERNYSAHDMERFLADVGFGEAVEPFRRRAVPKMHDLVVAPMVPMTYINGVGVRTPLQLVFSDDDFDAPPETAAYGDGDGKLNLISVLAFEKEMGRQPGQRKQFRSIKINKAQHSTIVMDDFALDRVIQEIIEVNNNNQQIPSY